MPRIFCDHSGIKLEINGRRKNGKTYKYVEISTKDFCVKKPENNWK